MKKSLLLIALPILAIGVMLFSSFGGGENSDYPSGSPAGYTSSPGDGTDCVHCHGGSSTFVDGWITSDIPPSGYAPGNVYNITVTVTGSGDKGFQVSPQNPSGLELGTLIAGDDTHLNGGTKYVNHNSKKTSNPATWNFQWTAPAPGTGEVTFYGAFTVNKPVTKTSILVVQEGSVEPLVVDATADPDLICTGDSSQLDVMASGGTGSYSYSWTSYPPGFTSDLKDPWVLPIESTTYFVHVTSGDISANDSVDVNVYCLGTNENDADQIKLNLFPNPVTSHLTVVVDGPGVETAEMMLYSLSGELLVNRQITREHAASSVQVDMRAFPAGSYLICIGNGKNKITRKIVKIN
ncbi:choice-of-anchor V domain-containing protein [Bacteroidota bacterium]